MTALSPEYEAYLDSEAWRAKRQVILARDGYTCQRCGQQPRRLEVHHRHYWSLYRENPQDLVTLCSRCHAALEGRPVKKRGGWILFFPRLLRGHGL